MAIGEYAGILGFGILSTGILAYDPQILPSLIIGAFIISLLFVKVVNWSFFRIEKTKLNFLIFSLLAGIVAFIGIYVSVKTGLIFKLNGLCWMFMGISIMKYNLDNLLK